jgi:hypothetical protein
MKTRRLWKMHRSQAILPAIVFIAICSPINNLASPAQDIPAQLLAIPPHIWAVDCANNEILVIQATSSATRSKPQKAP